MWYHRPHQPPCYNIWETVYLTFYSLLISCTMCIAHTPQPPPPTSPHPNVQAVRPQGSTQLIWLHGRLLYDLMTAMNARNKLISVGKTPSQHSVTNPRPTTSISKHWQSCLTTYMLCWQSWERTIQGWILVLVEFLWSYCASASASASVPVWKEWNGTSSSSWTTRAVSDVRYLVSQKLEALLPILR